MANEMEEREYLVTWQIDITASSPEEAAHKARAIQLNPDSIADVFIIKAHQSEDFVTIDLSEMDEREID